MPIRVIQWATGQLGADALKRAILHPAFEVVGVFVYTEAKAGVDAGDLVGLPPIGVKTTMDKEEIFALGADLVIHSPQFQETMDEHDTDVIRLLESGKNVISMMGYFNPRGESDEYADRLEAACRRGGVSLMGTGIDPGFVCERLATTISGLCMDINHLHVLEAYDCSCASELMLRTMGFGMTADEYHSSHIGTMWDRFFAGTPTELVHLMGGKVDRVERSYDILLSDIDQNGNGLPMTIPANTVCGNSWKWTAYVADKPFFTLQTQWQVGKPIAGWETVSGWTITIDGTPSLQLKVQLAPTLDAIVNNAPSAYNPEVMSALALNAAPELLAAPAGLFTAPVFAPFRIPAKSSS